MVVGTSLDQSVGRTGQRVEEGQGKQRAGRGGRLVGREWPRMLEELGSGARWVALVPGAWET